MVPQVFPLSVFPTVLVCRELSANSAFSLPTIYNLTSLSHMFYLTLQMKILKGTKLRPPSGFRENCAVTSILLDPNAWREIAFAGPQPTPDLRAGASQLLPTGSCHSPLHTLRLLCPHTERHPLPSALFWPIPGEHGEGGLRAGVPILPPVAKCCPLTPGGRKPQRAPLGAEGWGARPPRSLTAKAVLPDL